MIIPSHSQQWKGAHVFSDLIVAYLFLGGTGAGCCLVASLLTFFADADELAWALARRLRSPQDAAWRRFFGAMHVAALCFLVLGGIALFADVGRPDRLLLMLFQPSPSYVAFGAWSLVACIAASLLCALLWGGVVSCSRRLLLAASALAGVASVATMVYTGLMLSDMRAVPLWNTPWLALLFVLSALSCGIALTLVASFASRSTDAFATTLANLAKVDAVVIAVEAVVGAFCLLSVWGMAGGASGPADGTAQAAAVSLQSLLAGPWAVLFWAGFVFVGLAVPFVQDVVIGRASRTAVASSRAAGRPLLVLGTAACVLAGGFLLRLLVVEVALHPLPAFIS